VVLSHNESSTRFMVYSVKTYLFLPSLLLVLLGCAASPQSSPPRAIDASPISTPPAPTVQADAPVGSPTATPEVEAAESQSTVISAEGIGAARLGMTLGELKQTLGSGTEFTAQSRFMVDFDAIAVRQGGAVQYYILSLAGQPFTDSDAIQGLLTDNPDYQTAEGVGAGTTLAAAQAAYGQATLSYNTQNESREYVRFEKQPAPNISFATGNGSQDPAGVYPSSTSEYNETQEFQQNATIRSVLVICLTEGCTAPE
jgi:hypothetical protein